jgi:hypothetical protein
MTKAGRKKFLAILYFNMLMSCFKQVNLLFESVNITTQLVRLDLLLRY